MVGKTAKLASKFETPNVNNNNNKNNNKNKKNGNQSKIKEVKVKITDKHSKDKNPKKVETKIKIESSDTKNRGPATISGLTKTKPPKAAKATQSKNIEQHFTPLFSNVTPRTAYKHVTNDLGWNQMRIVAFLLLIVVFFLHIIATATKEWINYNYVQSQGLWRVCYEVDYTNELECFRYDVLPEYLKHMQALTMVALFVIIGAVIYFYFWLRKTTRPLFLLTVIIETAAILMMVTMSIFTDNSFCAVARSKLGTFGWSYYLGWFTTLLTICTGVFVQFKVQT